MGATASCGRDAAALQAHRGGSALKRRQQGARAGGRFVTDFKQQRQLRSRPVGAGRIGRMDHRESVAGRHPLPQAHHLRQAHPVVDGVARYASAAAEFDHQQADVARRAKIEVSEQKDSYKVHAELPGVKKEDIQLSVDGAQVTLTAEIKRDKEAIEGERVLHAERTYGKVTRSFTLPQEIDEAAVQAKFADGVLELTLPKKAAAARKQITIQ